MRILTSGNFARALWGGLVCAVAALSFLVLRMQNEPPDDKRRGSEPQTNPAFVVEVLRTLKDLRESGGGSPAASGATVLERVAKAKLRAKDVDGALDALLGIPDVATKDSALRRLFQMIEWDPQETLNPKEANPTTKPKATPADIPAYTKLARAIKSHRLKGEALVTIAEFQARSDQPGSEQLFLEAVMEGKEACKQEEKDAKKAEAERKGLEEEFIKKWGARGILNTYPRQDYQAPTFPFEEGHLPAKKADKEEVTTSNWWAVLLTLGATVAGFVTGGVAKPTVEAFGELLKNYILPDASEKTPATDPASATTVTNQTASGATAAPTTLGTEGPLPASAPDKEAQLKQ